MEYLFQGDGGDSTKQCPQHSGLSQAVQDLLSFKHEAQGKLDKMNEEIQRSTVNIDVQKESTQAAIDRDEKMANKLNKLLMSAFTMIVLLLICAAGVIGNFMVKGN